MNNSNNCETITKMNQESQNQKLRLFAKVDITTKLKILASQKQLFHKLKNSHADVDNVGTQRIWPARAFTLGHLTHNDLASVRI